MERFSEPKQRVAPVEGVVRGVREWWEVLGGGVGGRRVRVVDGAATVLYALVWAAVWMQELAVGRRDAGRARAGGDVMMAGVVVWIATGYVVWRFSGAGGVSGVGGAVGRRVAVVGTLVAGLCVAFLAPVERLMFSVLAIGVVCEARVDVRYVMPAVAIAWFAYGPGDYRLWCCFSCVSAVVTGYRREQDRVIDQRDARGADGGGGSGDVGDRGGDSGDGGGVAIVEAQGEARGRVRGALAADSCFRRGCARADDVDGLSLARPRRVGAGDGSLRAAAHALVPVTYAFVPGATLQRFLFRSRFQPTDRDFRLWAFMGDAVLRLLVADTAVFVGDTTVAQASEELVRIASRESLSRRVMAQKWAQQHLVEPSLGVPSCNVCAELCEVLVGLSYYYDYRHGTDRRWFEVFRRALM